MSNNSRVIMKTSDGGQTMFTREEARQSGLITDMIQNLGMNESNEDVIVPLDNTGITQETLQKIVEWTKKFADHESHDSIDKPSDRVENIDVELEAETFQETASHLEASWQHEFIANMDSDQIYHVLTAANYLQMKKFVVEAMKTVGTNLNHAAQLADTLILADQRGHYSHGVNRLHVYIEDTLGNVEKTGTPKILKQKGSTAYVDGCNLLGPVVGNFCTRIAIDLAKEHGIGWVGMSFTNTSPCVYPNRSSEQALGSNPICCVAPAENGDNFALDMATSTVEIAETKGHPIIPIEWGADSSGFPTTNPTAVLQGGGLLPLGGREDAGAYKGSGLGMMVEVFCGLLGGTPAGKDCRQWRESHKAANLAQCFVAIDPDCFASDFPSRMQRFLDQNRQLKPVEPELPVIVPGDPERMAEKRNNEAGGLVYGQRQIAKLVRSDS
ncbi:hypothetical protein M3Y98_00841500 [Aphelenchoides besseyi]|nr:hypothetical protein M3Y98_00841500 [Aphelenchoides besseyi]